MPLIIAGIIQDARVFPGLRRSHTSTVAEISYAGPVGPAERDAPARGRAALLHLIGFAEPFGLSVVESLATGTPVIATPLGSMPELLGHGSTGYLVRDIEAAVAAVSEVGELDRRECRRDAETRFSADRMVDDYLALFERILDRTPDRVRARRSAGTPTLFSHVPN